MSWSTTTLEAKRDEFCRLARHEGANVSELCRRYGISRKTGYKWLKREDLADRSRRPRCSPGRTAEAIETKVLDVRKEHPAWGARKIAHVLRREFSVSVAPSTAHAVLRRHEMVGPRQNGPAWQRFEHPYPNSLWQIDFKGHFAVGQKRCHPLTVLDDHSRFNVVLEALPGEDGVGVQRVLTEAFQRFGMPDRINADNGPPWGSAGRGVTSMAIWLIRLGVQISYSRPYHPQTNGKDERFHKTLAAEVVNRYAFTDLRSVQRRFDDWRTVYNCKRPHESLGMQTPADRYAPSTRTMPSSFIPIEYGRDDEVRRVQANGIVKFKGQRLRTSIALHGLPVAFRADREADGVYDLFFCHQRIDRMDLNEVQSDPD